jgi:polar amino acid transport system substrate-binding protein
MKRMTGNATLLIAFGLAAALVVKAAPASAAQPKCEPDKLASKYPGLVGKTIKIGQDGDSPPFSVRKRDHRPCH